MFTKNKNIKLLLNYGLGPVLFLVFSYSIYQQVRHQPHLDTAWYNLKRTFYTAPSWQLYLALLLVLVNWGVEARKWQVLIKPIQRMSFFRAFMAVLAGLAFSMNTPNRIGEFGGRVLYIHEGQRWKAVSLTIVGSFSQLIITLFFGLGGLIFLLNNSILANAASNHLLWIRALFYGTLIVSVFLFLLYFRLAWLVKKVEKIPSTHRFLQHIAVIENLPVRFLLRVVSLSITRYLVFVFQYILLLQLFDIQLPVWQAFWLISVLYLVLAIIPTIALAELGIRGQVSLLLFTLVSSNELGILGAATAIWLINLVIPALAGSLLFLGIKIFSDK